MHQQGLSVNEKILRHFDLSSQYGVSSLLFSVSDVWFLLLGGWSNDGQWLLIVLVKPCIGIPRMKRWKRAEGLGLEPPVEVLAVLIKEEKGKNLKAERAFMDGLLTSRLAVNE